MDRAVLDALKHALEGWMVAVFELVEFCGLAIGISRCRKNKQF
jgi:hypothetical protein